MKHNKIIILFLLLTIVPFVTSLDSIGTIKQNECVNISQMCSTCSYVNISSIGTKLNPDLVTNEPMSYFGNGEWRYEFCNTSEIGRYDVKGQGDINGVDSNFATYFDVSSSGETSTNNIIFYLVVLLIGYIINLIGFFNRNTTITILGGIVLTFVGLFMIQNGIIMYRNNLTLAISYITLFWGLGSSLWATIEEIKEY